MIQKRKAYRNQKILDAARGEECTLRLAPICSSRETVVFAHFNDGWAGKGMGQKADDLAGVFCCAECHRLYDQCDPSAWKNIEADLRRAYYRTIRRLFDKGVIK